MASEPAQDQRAYAPGGRVLIRNERWIVCSVESTSTGGAALHVTGLSELVRGRNATFLDETDAVEELRPEDTWLVHDPSPRYRRTRLYLESLLRRSAPPDRQICLGHRASMNLLPYLPACPRENGARAAASAHPHRGRREPGEDA